MCHSNHEASHIAMSCIAVGEGREKAVTRRPWNLMKAFDVYVSNVWF